MSAAKLATACALALTVAACRTVPPLEEERTLSVEHIVLNVECEIINAVQVIHRNVQRHGGDIEEHWLNDFAVSITMDLTTETTTSGSIGTPASTVTITAPLRPGFLSFGFGARRLDEKEAFGSLKYSFNLSALQRCHFDPFETMLAGNVGLQPWLERTALAMDVTGNVPETLTYHAQFKITREANGGLVITGAPLGDANISGPLAGFGQRRNTNKLLVSFTRRQDLPPSGPALTTLRTDNDRTVSPSTQRKLDEQEDSAVFRRFVDRLEDEIDD